MSEIFGPTLQGEGIHSGRRAIFIRMLGCDSRCKWCDTAYAKTTDGPGFMLTTEDIIAKIKDLKACSLAVLTGGNPAIHDLGHLCSQLKRRRMEIHIETQGTVIPHWFDRADLITICPKIHAPTDIPRVYGAIRKIRDMAPIQLKYVIFTEGDIELARDMARTWPDVPMTLQPGWDPETKEYPFGLVALAERVAGDPFMPPNVRFLPQLHRILWGERREV